MPSDDALHYDPPAPIAQVIFLQKAFRGRYLLIDSDCGILGRDVLASVILVPNGPRQEWSQQAP